MRVLTDLQMEMLTRDLRGEDCWFEEYSCGYDAVFAAVEEMEKLGLYYSFELDEETTRHLPTERGKKEYRLQMMARTLSVVKP